MDGLMPGIDYTDMTDREILLVVAVKVEDLDDAVNGSGRPGLVERVTALEASKPSAKERWGMIGTVAFVVAGTVAKLLGVPLPL
jgi:hypothetical protein